MTARDCVLEAKAMLSAMPGASLLSRDGFIAICVEAATAFLRKRGSSRSSNGLHRHSTTPPCSAEAGNTNNNRNRETASPPSVSYSSRNDSANKNMKHLSNSPVGASVSCDRSPREASVPLGEKDLRRLRELVEREYRRRCSKGGVRLSDADTARFSNVPPAKLEAARLIKRVLDEPYHRGELSRQKYSVIVLSVLEKLFPDPVSVKTNMTENNTSNSSRGAVNSSDGFVLDEKMMVDPPQDLQASLRPDVTALTERLTERALQHFLGSHNTTNNNNNHIYNDGEDNDHGLIQGMSPLPRKPHEPSPTQIVFNDSAALSSSASVHFDDAFELQVERLRQVLEEKYALDLSGARASSSRPGRHDSEDALARKKRDELLAEARLCQEELHNAQERLGSIMQELRVAERPSHAVTR
ncbi:hypothetical protein DQ04_04871030 [Trypanosoma grayi]|uniref:hypothetical protein n=1 Tax=Trypanosoma grayi TaxID=71804 RepID=UPI0004F40618|nr:hypothetical protein DQ04_04871030 [Trypanosoma grayi]KEG09650.1 hypothetical protein DQ04_04871030 [Trypanosoma grayi]